jgi:hypothetical protein
VTLLKYLGYAWCATVIIGYLAIWMTSEHGGGILSASGFGEIWLIALACLPGVALIKIAEAKK